MSKVAVFVDVGNLYYCIGKKFEARKLDYRQYMECCKEFGEIHQAFAYGNQTKEVAKGFIHCLQQIGFNTKFTEPNVRKPRNRTDWGCSIAVDVANVIERVDTIILGSSSGDLEPIVTYSKAKGANVIVIAAGINQRLKKSCSRYVEITESLLEALPE